uniref:NLR family CARD domain-containing protein 3-like n=1 Tax=Sphaeramia orbicularis TaxID=375764 RepID=A0A673AJP8_9TELE
MGNCTIQGKLVYQYDVVNRRPRDHKLKASLKRKFHFVPEGMTTEENQIPLNSIYTELFITEGRGGEVCQEHEMRQIEKFTMTRVAQEKSIDCNCLFDPLPGQGHQIRRVITTGVAGIGKTVSVNKFTLDWADDWANKNLQFVFPLSFRELNLMSKQTFSLEQLLHVFFPEVKDLDILTNDKHNILFILDGLDESRPPLNLDSEILSDVTKPSKIDVLLVNLFKRKLVPWALVWVTSRPVASIQILLECFDLFTEVRGFNDAQKDEYFRRKIRNETVANRIITHVKSCRSLHIMCHIPVFCRMTANALNKNLSLTDMINAPNTLTEMYLRFLAFSVETMKKRLPKTIDSHVDFIRENLMSLGKLAFNELEKGNLVFYKRDLKANGIDVSQASLFSFYTQIFKEEPTVCGEKTFCFVHLSVHEFFAALYVFLSFHNDNKNVLLKKSSASRFPMRDKSEFILYREAVKKALQYENGHFDMFLRFLLGLSLETNKILLKHLMTSDRTKPKTRQEIIKYIKEKIRASPSPDRCLNLFHCLNELHDHSLMEEIQNFFSSGGLNRAELSPAQWAILSYVLLTSEEKLDVFELSKYTRSEKGLHGLLDVVKAARVANLNACKLTVNCCEKLSSVISSSQIQELDLSNNNLRDEGLILLCGGLMNSKLETLRLRSCNLTEKSCDALSSVVKSVSGLLKELDLTDNDFEDVGVKKLCVGLGSPHCKLEILNLSMCRVTEEGCTFLVSALNSCSLRQLDLSYNHPGDDGLKLLKTMERDPQCKLEKLCAEQCGESRVQPGLRKYTVQLTLDPNTAHRDLQLSEGNKKATRPPKRTSDQDRADFQTQVSCSQGLTGRCYWETEWRGMASMGVAYRRTSTKGEGGDIRTGQNDSFWGLNCTKGKYQVQHKGTSTPIEDQEPSHKVGVFLDWSAGTLSFYSVSCGDRSHIRTLNIAFTEPVYPEFHLAWKNSSVYLN